MCESEESCKEIQDSKSDIEQILKGDSSDLRSLTWQSYLKESQGSKGCS